MLTTVFLSNVKPQPSFWVVALANLSMCTLDMRAAGASSFTRRRLTEPARARAANFCNGLETNRPFAALFDEDNFLGSVVFFFGEICFLGALVDKARQ